MVALRDSGKPRTLVQMQVAGKIEAEKNHDDHAYCQGVIAPTLAVRPDWKAPHKGYDNNHRENK